MYLKGLVITSTTAEEGEEEPAHNKKQDSGKNLFPYKSSVHHALLPRIHFYIF